MTTPAAVPGAADEPDEHQPPPGFYREMMKFCRCCIECGNPPCETACAGGVCLGGCDCESDDSDYGDDDDDER